MSDSLLEFPCDFPLKVMGRQAPDFEALVLGLVETETGPLRADAVQRRESRDGNFVSLTVTVRVSDQVQLDAVYEALTAHDRILMVL